MKTPTATPVAALADAPILALSIRQPWAWLILHGGKDVENRMWPTKVRGRILIHVAKGATDEEWENAFSIALEIDPALAYRIPALSELKDRGGIAGEVEIVDCVSVSSSPWFFGNWGFVLRIPKPTPFRPYRGRLGFFKVENRSEEFSVAEIRGAVLAANAGPQGPMT